MCDEVVDDRLAPLKFNPDWFDTSKMTKKLVMSYFLVMKLVFSI